MEKEDLQGQLAHEKTEGSSTALRMAELEAQLAIAISRGWQSLRTQMGPPPMKVIQSSMNRMKNEIEGLR